MTTDRTLCPDDEIGDLVSTLGEDENAGLALLDRRLRDYPEDARLHFLNGSMKAAARDYAPALDAMPASRRWVAVDVERRGCGFCLVLSP